MIKFIKYADSNSVFNSDQYAKIQFNTHKRVYFSIYRGYEINSVKQMRQALKAIHNDRLYQELHFDYNVNIKQELRKWKAYNIMYKMHKDTIKYQYIDFDYKDSVVQKFKYLVLSSLYWLLK